MCGWFHCVCFFWGGGGQILNFFPSTKRMGNFWILFFGFFSVDFIYFTIFKEKFANFF
jgi:hypothetical protein